MWSLRIKRHSQGNIGFVTSEKWKVPIFSPKTILECITAMPLYIDEISHEHLSKRKKNHKENGRLNPENTACPAKFNLRMHSELSQCCYTLLSEDAQ